MSTSSWDEGADRPRQDYSVSIDPSFSIMRNPFSEKKWRNFQLSRLFSSSSTAVKLQLTDVNIFDKGTKVSDQWLVVLTLGSGQTRNMALDRYRNIKTYKWYSISKILFSPSQQDC